MPAGQSEDDLESQVETEANQYIPFSLDEVNLDFQVLGPAPNSPEDVEVLIAASRKEKIEDRVAAAEAAGLKAIVMDVESYAAQTAFELIEGQFPETGKDQNIAMVDIGATIDGGQCAAQRPVDLHARAAVRRQPAHPGDPERLRLSAEEAEAAKRDGGLPENYESEVLQPFMDKMGLEVARALQFFFTSTQYNQVNHIVLSGGCAAIPGVEEAVAKRTQVNTIVANPFANMAVSSKIRPKNLTPGRALADGGLRPGDAEVRSMIRINLLPHRELRRKRQQTAVFHHARRRGRARRGDLAASCTRTLTEQYEDQLGSATST